MLASTQDCLKMGSNDYKTAQIPGQKTTQMPQVLNEASDDVAWSVKSSDDDIHVRWAKESEAQPKGYKKSEDRKYSSWAWKKQSIEAQKQTVSAAIKRNEVIDEQSTMALFAAGLEDSLSIDYFAFKKLAIEKLRKIAAATAASDDFKN